MRILSGCFFLVLSSSLFAQVSGDLHILEVHSKIFGNTRHLRVLLPEGYQAPVNRNRSYPVLYMNDGQNLFDSATSLFNRMEWKMDETTRRLADEHSMEPIIVVGIDTVGKRGRATEYLPYPDEYLHPPEPDVKGKSYPDFVVTEVMPLVNAQFRTLAGPANTAIGGSSYGAIAALYTAMQKPDVFGKLLIESPSLYIAQGKLFAGLEHAVTWPAQIYVGVGTNEGGHPKCPDADEDPEAVRDARRLASLARAHAEVRLVIEPCGVHNEDAWATRLPEALKFLFPHKGDEKR
jgi:predicted alpha/beta superfamily hydrolase